MYKNLFGYLTLILMLPSCGGVTPHIAAVCEEDNAGNIVIKWETLPAIEGNVKVYASDHPDRIPENSPTATADIAQLTLTIPQADSTRRHYYTLLFNDKHRVRVAPRNVCIPGIQNFRDIGGYPSNRTRKHVRWGMVYRSAKTDSLSQAARTELANLGIRTVIDLRTPDEIGTAVPLPEGIRRVNIPIPVADMQEILQDIDEQRIGSDTIYRVVEQMNRDIISKHTPAYQQLFKHVLLSKDNYPLLIQCSTGKGRTGIAIAILLHALGVNTDIITEDYCLSNTFYDIPASTQFVYQLPATSQEAVTTMLSARENFLNAAKDEIERRYGDLDIYIEKGIGLEKNEIKSLRTILLQ